MVLRRLAISNLLTHRVRTALTVAAIALSVSLVVAVTSGYASAEGAAHHYLNKYLGSADALGSCALPSLGQGRRLVAEVDGGLGVVVFRRPDGASQQVDLYACDDPTIVRTLTLPAP